MLNGLDPIMLFNLFKLTPSLTESISKIPVVSDIVDVIGLPPIPLYLSEKITGIYIDSENKNIDIETDVETKKDGSNPTTRQRAIGSVVTINMKAKKGSLGLTILNAMMEVILPKVTSREYSISYLHGSVTIFNGLLHSYSIDQEANTDLYSISIQISRGNQKIDTIVDTPVAQVQKVVAPLPALAAGG